MRILVILCSQDFNKNYLTELKQFDIFIRRNNDIVDYCGISNQDDFDNYNTYIQFKYKIINPKRQFSKICDFITQYKDELNYDWYIKSRPEILLLEPINFDILSNNAINSRTRAYKGPKKIKYGMSVNGEGIFKNIGDCHYMLNESEVILDDMIYIFHHNIINLNAFDIITHNNPKTIEYEHSYVENEWGHTFTWLKRNINLNIIGINLINTKYNIYSGDVNM